jgi:hypothetical protein
MPVAAQCCLLSSVACRPFFKRALVTLKGAVAERFDEAAAITAMSLFVCTVMARNFDCEWLCASATGGAMTHSGG